MGYKKIFLSVLTIFSVSLIAKALGFFRETFLAGYFGTSSEIDLYYLVYGIFFALASIIGSSIGIAYVPEHFKNKVLGEWRKKSFEMFFFTLIIALIIMLCCYFFSYNLAYFLDSNADNVNYEKLAFYIKINSLAFLFQTMTFFLISILNAEKKFGRGELVGTVYSLVVVLSLVFFYDRLKINAIIYSFLISSFLTFIILYLYVYGLKVDFPKINIKYYTKITIATLIGTSTIYVGQIYDRVIASGLSEGSVSALSYSGNIHSLVNVFFITSIVNVVYSELNSVKKSEQDYVVQLNNLFVFAFNMFALVLIPLSAFLYIFSNDIVSVIFERGNFDFKSVLVTSEVFQMYVLGSFFFALRDLGNKMFYTLGNQKTPIYLGVLFLLVNFSLCYLLANFLGVKGISLAVTITTGLYMIYLLYLLKCKYCISLSTGNIFDICKMLFFCFLFLFFFKYIFIFDDIVSKFDKVLRLSFSGVIFVFCYVLFCYVVNVGMVKNVVYKIIKKRSNDE